MKKVTFYPAWATRAIGCLELKPKYSRPMKTFASVGLLILVILLSSCGTTTTTTTSMNLLPGLTYYDGPEKLTGKLIFLLQHNKPKNEFDVRSEERRVG